MPKPQPGLRDPYTCILKTLAPSVNKDQNKAPLDITNRTWQWAQPQIEGVNPCARGGHTATLVTQEGMSAKVIVFGGSYNGDSTEGYKYINTNRYWGKQKC